MLLEKFHKTHMNPFHCIHSAYFTPKDTRPPNLFINQASEKLFDPPISNASR